MSAATQTMEIPAASSTTAELLQWLQAERDIAYWVRRPFIGLAYLSIRFWAGDQYADVVASYPQRWDRKLSYPAGVSTARKIDNQLLGLCRFALQTAAQHLPNITVEPTSEDELSKIKAAFATKILRWCQQRTKEDLLRKSELRWLVGAGECLRRTAFSAEGGDPGEPQGDILTEIINPFCYMKDPYHDGLWPPRYVIVEKARHVDWIAQRYGKKLKAEGLSEETQYLDVLATSVMNVTPPGQSPDVFSSPRNEMAGARMVTELCVPKSRKHPQGRTWVFSGDQLLDEHPLQAGVFPYSLAEWYIIPGRHRAMSLIEMIFSKQQELNHLVSLLFEAAIQGTRGDLLMVGMADPSQIKRYRYNERTGGEVIVAPPGTEKLERIVLAADWQSAEVRREVITQGMKEDAGASAPSLGQTTRKQTTAYEIQKLFSQNLGGIGWHIDTYSGHLSEVCYQELELLREFTVVPRIASVKRGPGVDPETMAFAGTDLKGAGEVLATPQPYMTREMQQEVERNAYGSGMLGPFPTAEHEWAARTILKRLGLWELENEIARSSMPMQELEEIVRQERRMEKMGQQAALAANVQAAATMQAQGQAQQQDLAQQQGDGGQQPQGGGPGVAS